MLTKWIIKHGDQGRLGETFDSVLKAVLDIYSSDSDQTAKKFGSDIQQLLDPLVGETCVVRLSRGV